MSQRPVEPVFRLVFSADGKAEVLREGATVWASDDDPDFAEEFGHDSALTANNQVRESDIADVIDYLLTESVLTPNQAARMKLDIPETIHVIEDLEAEDDDELDPDWDDEDDEDNTDE
jgi:hypothetical protein